MKELLLVFISGLLGGLMGFLASSWSSIYTAKATNFTKRIDEICNAIDYLVENSCKYWILTSESAKQKEIVPLIIGQTAKIRILLEYLDSEYKNFDSKSIKEKLHEFNSACTGDNFGGVDNNIDPDRQRKIIINGEKLKIDLLKVLEKKI